MANNTKSVQLTADEIQAVIRMHSANIMHSGEDDVSEQIERMKYLAKRRQDFATPKLVEDWGNTQNG